MAYESLKTISLLYVEDDESVMEVFSRGIKRRVKELYVATNGKEGLEKYKEFNPDMIITDIKMPIMNGIEMISQIRGLNFDVPIIVTSADEQSNTLRENNRLNINGYITKPIDKKKLFKVMEDNIKN